MEEAGAASRQDLAAKGDADDEFGEKECLNLMSEAEYEKL